MYENSAFMANDYIDRDDGIVEDHEESRLLRPDDADDDEIPEHYNLPTFTYRSLIVGLLIGIITCLSNVYFGLQTGFGDTMAMATSLLGYALFRPFSSILKVPFGPKENVLIQTVSGVVASMPMTAGLVSVIVALESLISPSECGPLHFSYVDLAIWALGFSFIGPMLSILVQNYILKQESLPFPSATATAAIIKTLHTKELVPPDDEALRSRQNIIQRQHERREDAYRVSQDGNVEEPHSLPPNAVRDITAAFALSGIITFIDSFLPILHNVPFLGSYLAQKWLWTFNLSAGNFGQGDVSDWVTGSRGWTLWVGLAILLTDCLVNMIAMVFTFKAVLKRIKTVTKWDWTFIDQHATRDGPERRHFINREEASPRANCSSVSYKYGNHALVDRLPNLSLEPTRKALVVGLFASAILCVGTSKFVFGEQLPVGVILLAISISLFLGLASIVAVGQTDHSPVSGLSKLSQFVFALIISKNNPNRLIINLGVGAIGEASAMQATVLMFDLKTGSLLGANSFAQVSAHMLGSIFGAFLAAGFFKLYRSTYQIPGPLFQTPTAYIWVAAARLAYSTGLPKYSKAFSLVAAGITAVTTTLKVVLPPKWGKFVPGGVAFAIGMYNMPAFTLPRALGGVAYWVATTRFGVNATTLKLVAAGLILGEIVLSLTGLFISPVN